MTFKERLLLRVAPWSSVMRYGATLLFGLLITVIWWHFCYQPIATTLHERCAAQETVTQQERLYTTAHNDGSAATALARETFFSVTTHQTFVKNMIRLAQQEQLQLFACTNQPGPTRSWCQQTTLQFTFVGDFFAHLKLIDYLETVVNSCPEKIAFSLDANAGVQGVYTINLATPQTNNTL